MSVDVPERVVPVAVIEMCVAAEHLLDDTFHIAVVVVREARGLANPVLSSEAGEGREGLCECGWAGGNGGGATGRGGWVGGGGDFAGRVGGEDNWVVDFAYDPFLHADDVGGSRDFGWSPVLKPGVSEAAGGHGWAVVLIADGVASIGVGFLDYLDHASEKAVHLDNYWC